jgi:hypothetical protein
MALSLSRNLKMPAESTTHSPVVDFGFGFMHVFNQQFQGAVTLLYIITS